MSECPKHYWLEPDGRCECQPGTGRRQEAALLSKQEERDYEKYQQAVIENAMARPTSVVSGLVPTGEVRTTDEKTGGQKGSKMARFDLLPYDALWAIAEVFGFGTRKYTDRNWERGYKWGLSVAALQRHLTLRIQGEVFDVDPNFPPNTVRHLAQVAWHAIVLLTFELRGIGTDNITMAQPLKTREQLEREANPVDRLARRALEEMEPGCVNPVVRERGLSPDDRYME